jgi:sterol desaturase/sphingolipid hydroxylase (fatty acid hydroxylase superfamily)
MHRVHHSILRRETDSNFGFNLPWWDRLFGTYTKSH